MNERIKELCKEAAEVHLKTMSPKTHTTPLYLLDKLAQSARESGIEIVSDGFCEKFAELIVKECVLEAMDAQHHNTSIRLQLYKHFGVE